MRGYLLKELLSMMITLLFVGSLLTSLGWYMVDTNNVQPRQLPPLKKSPTKLPELCKNCDETVKKAFELYSEPWKKQEDNYNQFRSQLNTKCNALENAIITQANTPKGTKILFDGDKKTNMAVNEEIFGTLIKENPFPNKTWSSCAVVGNGGILANSSCGRTIDAAQYVIRCNLPPLSNGLEKDVGSKTDIVTANPSIIIEKYFSLMQRRRPFAEALRSYGNALVLLPAFSFRHNTALSLRAFYTIDDFRGSARAVYFNPKYLRNLATFWRSKGLKSPRLSTGIMMASIALEMCSEVHLYGFWPFEIHPYSSQTLMNHYYDDRKAKNKFHAMPTEFNLLLKLHREGVLRLHLGECHPDEK
ncbi:alpha-2,8-sialyltransferase 8F [Oryzias melastigma]|uniref:ST8 alpha-N-acetyl-neuraminide alpha-2,8-sialyltransferase 6 n=1 Tax=Oryzias melastigma TaxID=30732 RepID=A0A3B3E026_ORYME|nr:alpha-2,8-sialyltransferase 8F [Oryzias melastigma]